MDGCQTLARVLLTSHTERRFLLVGVLKTVSLGKEGIGIDLQRRSLGTCRLLENLLILSGDFTLGLGVVLLPVRVLKMW